MSEDGISITGVILSLTVFVVLTMGMLMGLDKITDIKDDSKDSKCSERFGEGYTYETVDQGYYADFLTYCIKVENEEIVDKREVTF